MNKISIKKLGFLQALGVFVYIALVDLFINNAEKIVGNIGLPFGPMLMLLLLSVSVLICAILVLYKPYKLFVEGKKNEASKVVVYTALWLFILLVIGFAALIIFK